MKISLALDWTPNVNHIGFFVAQAKGWYKNAGIELNIVDPSMNNYRLTPAKMVERGEADFALCPLESIISYRTKNEPFPLVAAAAVFHKDLSAIAVVDTDAFKRPKQLNGKTYASYKARYEDAIVKQMLINDGAKGDLEINYPKKLGIWETLLKGDADATWIFKNWEGVQAEQRGLELGLFSLADYGIPYSYSPVIACNEELITTKLEAYSTFLKLSKKGFCSAFTHPKEAVAILGALVPAHDQDINLERAIEVSRTGLNSLTDWGKIDLKNLEAFLAWLRKCNLEHSKLKAENLISSTLQKAL
jgi:ABC-type nitrate/sulfonate/bicarbonate transport system substrate-binding protein